MTPKQAVWVLIAGSALIRLICAFNLGLGNDEAYHFLYAAHPALSYYDHPPMMAWVEMVGLSLSTTRASTWALRIGFILLFGGSTWLLARLTTRSYGAWAGFLAAFALNVTGYYGLAAATFALPDGPLLFFWLLAIDRLEIALGEPNSKRLAPWVWVGVAWGGAMLSKYHAVLLPLGTGLYVMLHRPMRRWLLRPGPYLAFGLGLLLFSPVLVWNASHGWASFLFQGGRAVGSWTFRGYDLRLMSSVKDVNAIPTAGKRLVIVAAVDHVHHFRIFDNDGKMVVDTDATQRTALAPQIEDLRKQLESLWPPHELTTSEKGRVIDAVTSIVGHTPFRPDYLLVAILAQAAYLFPWIWGSLILILIRECWNWRSIASDQERFWLCLAVVPLGVFTAVACFRPVLPHWGLIGLVSLFPILGSKWAARLERRPAFARRLLSGCAGFSLVILVIAIGEYRYGWLQRDGRGGWGLVDSRTDPTLDLYGWDQVADRIKQLGLVGNPRTFIFTSYWYQSAHLAHALGREQSVLCYNADDPRGFAFWSRPEEWIGRDGILVVVGEIEAWPRYFRRWFGSVEAVSDFWIERSGKPVRRIQLYRCLQQREPFPYGMDRTERLARVPVTNDGARSR
jgi:4-amino-4-deoxy-L-arabinose transferase-like glycosyltransferase